MNNPLEGIESIVSESMTPDESLMLDIIRNTLEMYGYDYSEMSLLDMADYAQQLIEGAGMKLTIRPKSENSEICNGIRFGFKYVANLAGWMAKDRPGPRSDVLLALETTLAEITDDQIKVIAQEAE